MTLKEAVEFATTKLSSISDSARLDAQLLICHACNIEQTSIIAHPEQLLSRLQIELFNLALNRRSKGEPLAYITGSKEFWSLTFAVNQHTLVPRPETELLVEIALQVISDIKSPRVLDLGTGSGAIAISIAKERKDCLITATDISHHALEVAKKNALIHKTKINFIQSDWYKNLTNKKFNVIVCNPPYIEKDDPELCKFVSEHEPRTALISKNKGLNDLEQVINNARNHLTKAGHLIVEHGFQQATQVKDILGNQNFNDIAVYKDLSGLMRATAGQLE